ncbi:hypothetical protein LTR85_009028 [Meristemomyces frigidus]|nr:hypothetical protein LTR85_009028 [Meristemomyces frigidus]
MTGMRELQQRFAGDNGELQEDGHQTTVNTGHPLAVTLLDPVKTLLAADIPIFEPSGPALSDEHTHAGLGSLGKLPPELRVEIYNRVYDQTPILTYFADVDVKDGPHIVEFCRDDFSTLHANKAVRALMQVCRQTRVEARPVFYGKAILVVCKEPGVPELGISRSVEVALPLIRNLRLVDHPPQNDEEVPFLPEDRFTNDHTGPPARIWRPTTENRGVTFDDIVPVISRCVELTLTGTGTDLRCTVGGKILTRVRCRFSSRFEEREWYGIKPKSQGLADLCELGGGFMVATLVKVFGTMSRTYAYR